MNTPDHVGRSQTVEALGKTWTLSRWSRAVWNDFLAWAKTKLPDPRVEGRKTLASLLPQEGDAPDMRAALAEARNATAKQINEETLEYLTVNSKRVNALLDTMEGTEYLTYLLLRGEHPEADTELAYQIVLSVGSEAMSEKLKLCAGVGPKKDASPGNDAKT